MSPGWKKLPGKQIPEVRVFLHRGNNRFKGCLKMKGLSMWEKWKGGDDVKKLILRERKDPLYGCLVSLIDDWFLFLNAWSHWQDERREAEAT